MGCAVAAIPGCGLDLLPAVAAGNFRLDTSLESDTPPLDRPCCKEMYRLLWHVAHFVQDALTFTPPRPCCPFPPQRDFGMECLLLRLVAMSTAECEAQLAQLLAGTGAAGPSL